MPAVYSVGQCTDDAGYSHGLMDSFTRWIVFIGHEKKAKLSLSWGFPVGFRVTGGSLYMYMFSRVKIDGLGLFGRLLKFFKEFVLYLKKAKENVVSKGS